MAKEGGQSASHQGEEEEAPKRENYPSREKTYEVKSFMLPNVQKNKPKAYKKKRKEDNDP